jgi:hypothetical protein
MRRTWAGARTTRLAAVARLTVLVSIVALALVGCGGSGGSPGGVSARVYATSVCRALGPFERQIATGSRALTPLSNSTSSPASRKAMLEHFLDAVARETGATVAQLKSAGHPEIAHGRAIATAFVTAFARLQKAMETAAAASRRLPTDSADAFRTAAASLGNSVKSSVGGGVEAGLTGLRSRTLEAAAAKVAACHSLE